MNVLKPHISLNVTAIDRSVEFYERAFGVSATKRRPGYAKFDLQSPSLNLSMVEAPRTGVNASHFGIQVASSEDVAEARQRFESLGLATLTEDDTTCCYAVQDKVWIEDPDGNSWEVFVVKADAAAMNADARAGKATSGACCVPAVAKPKAGADQVPSCCAPTNSKPSELADQAPPCCAPRS